MWLAGKSESEEAVSKKNYSARESDTLTRPGFSKLYPALSGILSGMG